MKTQDDPNTPVPTAPASSEPVQETAATNGEAANPAAEVSDEAANAATNDGTAEAATKDAADPGDEHQDKEEKGE